MRKTLKALMVTMSCILVIVMAVSISEVSAADRIREADVATPEAGNVFILVKGKFVKADVNEVLNRINEMRKEACDKGYPIPGNPSKKLTSADYRPMTWNSNLEVIAQTRAAEADIYMEHMRPNGKKWYTVTSNGEQSNAENLAWNFSGIMIGLEQWYGEKEDWINQTPEAVTGHYTSLINPAYRSVGIGCFAKNWYTVCGEFRGITGESSASVGVDGAYLQKVEVPFDSLTFKPELKIASKIGAKGSGRVIATYDGTEAELFGTTTVTSSNSKVAKTNGNSVEVVGVGKATIRLICAANGKTVTESKELRIDPAQVKLKSAKKGKKQITLSYSKVKEAGKCQIAYKLKTSKKWSYKTTGKTKYVLKKLKSKKKYQVKVRAFKKVGNETFYGPWSKPKSVKVK